MRNKLAYPLGVSLCLHFALQTMVRNVLLHQQFIKFPEILL